ncbi:unnamed protein product [Protopolystoma xenopodis]|uniref:Small ribosomal subunit protein mS35 mitochondrial conserved domain-containing protein n=1 Tax=Protopolystoma xenopodis TaxID=117903 RepID=A0A448WYN0_9PLAT|nr:unnamed protein product [Protopolystoma xenopodis]
MKVPMSNLNLSEEARARFLYLAVSTPSGREVCKIDWDKEILKMSSAKCPTVQQNYDYLIFVLTVLTLESKKPLSWDLGPETLAPHEWPQFLWDSSLSRQRLIRFASRLNPPAVVTRSSGL